MDRLILDTSVLVAVERGHSSFGEIVSPTDDLAVAAVTVAELLVGVALATGRLRAKRTLVIERALRDAAVLPFDLGVAHIHARLAAHGHRTGRQRGAYDTMIAATAIAHDRTVVTADARGFQGQPGLSVRVLP